MATNLTDMTLTPVRERALVRNGVVVATGIPVTVDVGGVNVQAGRMTHYTPTVGDKVALVVQDASWLILGETV